MSKASITANLMIWWVKSFY